MKKRRLSPFRGDRSLWIIVSVLLVFSLLVIYSSTVSKAYVDASGDTSYFMFRQAKFIVFSFLAMVFIHWVDFKSYSRYIRTFFYLSVVLVIAAMFMGESRNDATRWIPIPFFGRFQPSEMLKVMLVALLAVQLGSRSEIINRIPILPALSKGGWERNPQKNRDIWNKTTKPLVLPAAIACAVILPMNLSTSVVLFIVTMIIFLVGRVRVKEIWRIIRLGTVSLTVVIAVMTIFGVGRASTWINRIENYVSPIFGIEKVQTAKDIAENFQKEQAKIAIASGGVFGQGPGNSTQRSQLPHPYSDYAYAFIIEEYGAVGGVIIFLLYLWVFYRSGVIMRRCRNATTALLVFGLSLSITLQAFVNMLVCVGLFPVTGQPLPLISMGGSSVMFTCVAFGMILSVSRQNNEDDIAQAHAAHIAQQNGDTAIEETEGFVDDSVNQEDTYDEQEIYDEQEDKIKQAYTPINAPIYHPSTDYNNKKETIANEEEQDDDFPFTLVEHSDSTNDATPKKVERDVIDLY